MSAGREPVLPASLRGAVPLGFRTAIERRLGIDTRALAAFRIAVGAILAADLCYRTRTLAAFYTDAGVLPGEANAALYPTLSAFSLHGLSGAAWLQWVLFGVAGVLAVLLVVGYRTRTVAVGSWVLLASLQFRNYLVLNGGDTVLLVALFVALFLPLGERWSLDALAARRTSSARRGGDRPTPTVFGFGTAALLSQVVLVYATNAVFKHRSDAWTGGVAIPNVYQVDRFTALFGEYIAAFPGLLEALNYGWLALLIASPLLVVATGRRRGALVGAFATAHVGMYLTLDLGFFPHAMLACLLPFLPPGVWDRLEPAADPVERAVLDRLDGASRLGHSDPLLPEQLRAAVGRLVPAATATILVVGLLWQGVALGYVSSPDRTPIDPADHNWKLFAPNPPTSDGWFVVNGTLATGATLDLYPHANTTEGPPGDAAATYPSTRWRKYLAEVRRDATVRRYFADYLCRWGADRYGTAVESLSITYARRPGGAEGTASIDRLDLGQYRCPVVG